MDNRAYWIWIQQAFPPGSRKPTLLSAQYAGGLREFCQGGPRLWNSRRDLTDRETAALRDFSISQAEARLEYAERLGWQVLTPECEKYPELLRNISDPPAVLYLKGSLPDVDSMVSIGIAGARKATQSSLDAARKFGYQLAAGGACVVSGGAKGVDAAALTGALGIPGSRMVSVLPVSLDSTYVTENAKLRNMICSHGGALVTEYFSLSHPEFGTFQARNRLITGLSRGTLLIQAARKSGTMIYATHALDQNRDLFVYPGPEGTVEFAGSRELIEDGARAVVCGEDILAEYGGVLPEKPQPQVYDLFEDLVVPALKTREAVPALADAAAQVSPQARQVLAVLGREPLDIAALEAKTGLPASSLLGLLTELELEGLAESLPGKRYLRGI
ncbi:DNA-processing protein DprA [Neglectibacter caecimuris]|uniref:DNA-processing protein DprA n=1 Tax=Neglectibacter caecimuris TaxID=3093658 RepID=UPI002AC92AC3|nr:DNA-processing protein DprA [Neglectibacter sp. M00184]